jgi:hypothetical protein
MTDTGTFIVSSPQLRVLILLRSPFFLKNFHELAHALSQKYQVSIAFSSDKIEHEEIPLLEELFSDKHVKYVDFYFDRNSSENRVLLNLTTFLDCCRYYSHDFDDFPILRDRGIRKLKSITYGHGYHLFLSVLRRLRIIDVFIFRFQKFYNFWQSDRNLSQWIKDNFDAVVVSPLTPIGSEQAAISLAVKQSGKKLIYGIYSWDNLTNKGMIRPEPDLALVWNNLQKEELLLFHKIKSEIIVVGGSPGYEKIIKDSQNKAMKKSVVNNLYDDPILHVLWLGSSGFISNGNNETRAFMEMYEGLERTAGRYSYTVRPHPQNEKIWEFIDKLKTKKINVNPKNGEIPAQSSSYSVYINQLTNADIVIGINTSAMLEALILGKQVVAYSPVEIEQSQFGTLHFNQLPTLNLENFTVCTNTSELINHLKLIRESEVIDSQENLSGKFVQKFFSGVENPKNATKNWESAINELLSSKKIVKYSVMKRTNQRMMITVFCSVRFFLILTIALRNYFVNLKISIRSALRRNSKEKFKFRIRFLTNKIIAFRINRFYTKGSKSTDRTHILKQFERKITKQIQENMIMGDSIFYRTSIEDRDPRTLKQMLETKGTVMCIGSAYDMRIFRRSIEVLNSTSYVPTNVLIEINIRSFSIQWHKSPDFAFSKELAYLDTKNDVKADYFFDKELWNKKILETTDYGLITTSEYQKILKSFEKITSEGANLTKERLILDYFYNYDVVSTNRILQEIIAINDFFQKRRHNRLVYFIAPINYEYFSTVMNSATQERLISNIEKIREITSNFSVHDLSKKFGRREFLSRHEKTEHLNDRGRLLLAKEIKGILNQ